MYEVNNKVVLVTGAAGGIGTELVRAFLEEGAKNVAALDIQEKDGQTLEEEMNLKYGAKVKFFKCDVTKDLDEAYDAVVKEFGYIDVVVNNAGIMNDDPKLIEKQIAINVTALITSSMKAYDMMHKQRGGRGGTIINISSILALDLCVTLPVYSATKVAVLQFSNGLGDEFHYSKSGVRVLTMCFGATETPLLDRFRCIDEKTTQFAFTLLQKVATQGSDSAVRGVMEAFKQGSSGSTWLINNNKPAQDISDNMKKARDISSIGVF